MSNYDTMWRFLCFSIFFIYGVFQLTDAVTLKCYTGSLNDYEETTLDKPEVLITSGCIQLDITTALFAIGFKSNADSDTTKAILTGMFLYQQELNVALVDWSDEAWSPNITIIDDAVFYSLRAVPASIRIGKELGKALVKLAGLGLQLLNTIIIGFSLGAIMAGYAGREVKSEGEELWMIHGVEPANPLFGDPLPIFEPVNKNDAKYVFCTHSDPGYFGINEANCLADFWMNYGHYATINGFNRQPGCPSRLISRGCSHVRGALVAGEALRNPGTVLASGAPNYSTWVAQAGSSTNVIDIGNFLNMTHAVGNYYFNTNSEDPYGKGQAGTTP